MAQTLTLEVSEADVDLAESLFHEHGCLGLEVRDGSLKPMPGQRQPAPGSALLVGYVDDEGVEALREALAESFPEAAVEVAPVVEQDWSEKWKDLVRSVETERLWVGPPWDAVKAPAGKVQVPIEPGMAFGTGDHPTTHYCLGAVDRGTAWRAGASVLDVGTGSAVLLIAARKLGAGRCVGTDNDPVAIRVARENAERNGTPELELSTDELSEVRGPFDLVIANIQANVLVELAPAITRHVKVGGRLHLAGILIDQVAEVRGAYEAQGLALFESPSQGEWAFLGLEKRA